MRLKPAMEKAKHDANKTEYAPDQNIEPADRRTARETDSGHETVENGLAERVIHEVEPDPRTFAIAFDGNDSKGENIDVKSQAETGKRVEIVSGEHAQCGL